MIFAVDIDGTNLRQLCQGQMPSWSPDGTRFACSRREGAYGIAIMTADGQLQRQLLDGWSAQWSPDGKMITYYDGPKLFVYDLASGVVRRPNAFGHLDRVIQSAEWRMDEFAKRRR